MTKKQIRKVAKIYAACVVYNSLGTGAGTTEIIENDNDYFEKQIDRIAGMIASGLPNEIFQLASLEQIIQYVINSAIK